MPKKNTVFSLYMCLLVSNTLFCMLRWKANGGQENIKEAFWGMARKGP